MGIKIIADNKKARFDYEILEKYEAGMVLTGSEVKSIREGEVSLKDSYVAFKNGEAFLQNAHINVYKSSSYNNHHPAKYNPKKLASSYLIISLLENFKHNNLVNIINFQYFYLYQNIHLLQETWIIYKI